MIQLSATPYSLTTLKLDFSNVVYPTDAQLLKVAKEVVSDLDQINDHVAETYYYGNAKISEVRRYFNILSEELEKENPDSKSISTWTKIFAECMEELRELADTSIAISGYTHLRDGIYKLMKIQ